jgi:secondary thiamine-phosphate synthase enzyme
MNIIQETIAVSTSRRCEMIDITSKVASAVSASGITAGTVVVFCPHTTAAITINENADPDVTSDMLMTLEELFPQDRPGYRHCEDNSDSHIKSSLVGSSEQILIKDGRMTLGTWQGIYFCEFDGPRNRTIIIQLQGQ